MRGKSEKARDGPAGNRNNQVPPPTGELVSSREWKFSRNAEKSRVGLSLAARGPRWRHDGLGRVQRRYLLYSLACRVLHLYITSTPTPPLLLSICLLPSA